MKTRFLLFLLLLIPIYSCSKNESFQFTLYLENSGSLPNCKTIKVSLDGEEIFANQVCAAGVSPNVTTITFQIKSGDHKLIAEIMEDSKIFDQVVEFNEAQKYGYLTYNNKTSDFSFFINSTGAID